MSRRIRLLTLAAAAVLLAGCATVPQDPAARAEYRANNDPFEPLNRKTFALNQFLDRVLIKPLALGYRRVLPEGGRDAVRNFLDNLNEPLVFVNTVLQGRIDNARTTGCRFVVNTTLGLVGIADVASKHDLPKQVGDFGQTLWTWRVPPGPYIIVPLFGPTNPRDGIGTGIDLYLDPFRYVARQQAYGSPVTLGRIILDGVDKRSRNIESLDEMQKEAIDYYASFRSLFKQNRQAELRGEVSPSQVPLPDLYNDPGR